LAGASPFLVFNSQVLSGRSTFSDGGKLEFSKQKHFVVNRLAGNSTCCSRLFFIPKDFSLQTEYEKGFKINELSNSTFASCLIY
jgi:hypothetical protein